MGVEKYRNQLIQLLPQGKAFSDLDSSEFGKLLLAIADGLARVDGRAKDLLEEADPRTTHGLLRDWERLVGLPDECTGLAETMEIRRQHVVAKLIQGGGQSIAFLKEVALSLGYSIEIEEFEAFEAGDRAGDRCYDDDWMHAFCVIAPEETIRYFRAGKSVAGERLAVWGNDMLECVISRTKPAHATVIFSYQ